jgi:methylated-DNA-[protein]-cysteine S-methyltransferase
MILFKKKMIREISIKTKFGWISASEVKGKICKVKFGKANKQSKSNVLKKFKINLLKFFARKASNIEAPYKIKGNQIQKKVWAELRKIKPGKTKSYGEIAKKFKLSPRYIGKICSQNQILLGIPCHRVIKSDGSMGGFSSFGGIKLKKKLLKFEKNWV